MNIKRGFTLIELLIVIVIIGILAAAVITAINPVEQIKKAKDSSKMSTANELQKALEVYYTENSEYPWETTAANDNPDVPGGTSTGTALSPTPGWMSTLTNTASVKAELANRDFSGMVIFYDATDGVLTCFTPDSEAYTSQAAHNTHGVPDSSSPTYYCVR